MNIVIMVLIFLAGIVIGSFLNVCIYRIPKEESIAKNGSACMSCGAKLTLIDLIPVFSYLVLRGKCRHCKTRFSAQYPIIEAITGVLFLLLYLKFGLNYVIIIYAALIAILIVITLIDYRHMIIPNGLIIAGLVVGVAQLIAAIFTTGIFENWLVYVIGFFAGGLPLLLIALFTTFVLKKEAIGGGDIKLMAFAGLILGWKLLIPAFFIGIVVGAIVSVVLMATKKKKRGDEIPFGPFLCFGILVSIFFGQEIFNWYLGMF
ncbi:MAG: prepilin peptidase [Clostridia bacterium]|jgi:leader peptidase (prepilin peptidase) / N-methyltransferase|nr:prepilin peptidase [Clostridia bacterium]